MAAIKDIYQSFFLSTRFMGPTKWQCW